MLPISGPRIYPKPKNMLNIPEIKSLSYYSQSSGYSFIIDSIISGKDGIRINGSTRPLRHYPITRNVTVSGKPKSSDGPTKSITTKARKHAKMIIARFSTPLGTF